jgi:hypothetical protein
LPRPSWEDRFSELAEYHRIHGHCNVPVRYSENIKLGIWVGNQRMQYKLEQEGKRSFMTTCRIQKLESLGFEWDSRGTAWEDRLSELADYRKIHGHCNVPKSASENPKLGIWVGNQRKQYRLHLEGKISSMTLSRIQELEGLVFEGGNLGATWEDRLSELADYRKIYGQCNVPNRYSENTKLGAWVKNQRSHYKLREEGKISPMTPSRIQALESLGFEWDSHGAAWDDRLSELAEYRESHGHCNVLRKYSENSKLGCWVNEQRRNYRVYLDGKKSSLTTVRIQELESLDFVWNILDTAWEDCLSELTDYYSIHGHCKVPHRYSKNSKLGFWVKTQRRHYKLYLKGEKSSMTLSRIQELEGLGFE